MKIHLTREQMYNIEKRATKKDNKQMKRDYFLSQQKKQNKKLLKLLKQNEIL